MRDFDDLSKILPLLRSHGVVSFKDVGLEIQFGQSEIRDLSYSAILKDEKDKKDKLIDVAETHLPPDLRADEVFNFDKVLNWSGSPEAEDHVVPLTGDEPIA